jgi:restriction system protein
MSDGKERTNRELKAATADHVGLTELQRAEMLPTGKQTRADNRVGWALSFLTRAEALERPARGRHVITQAGRDLLAEHPAGLTEQHLRAIPAYVEYTPVVRNPRAERGDNSDGVTGFESVTVAVEADTALDPVEQIESGISRLNADVASQLIARLRDQHPDFLEQAVLELLVAMGYGGAEGSARRIGGSGDGGVDGVIDQDALGLDQVYVQAKRYAADNTVARETIQAFVGALHGNQATRGVFITTSRFSQGAREYAAKVPSRVILIDGDRLAALMIKYRIGTQVARTYNVVEVDEDFFE